MKLKDKIAIVTGGGSGIGKAIALMFAQEGAKIVLSGRRVEKINEVAEQIKSSGGDALPVQGDMGCSDDVKKMVKSAIDTYGHIDILVNNVAVIHQAKVVDTTEEDWDRVIRNNLKSCFLCSKEVAKHLIERNRGGKIVNISSIHAVLSEPSCCIYTAAKGGMEAFSRTLATELAPYKINVNYLEPGATYTELTTPMYTEAVTKALFTRIPMQEIAQPEWIASGALFLASDDSRYMTGQGITIDGGYVMDGSLPGAAYWED